MVYWEDWEPGWLDWIWVTKPLLELGAKPPGGADAAVGVGGVVGKFEEVVKPATVM